MAVLPGCGGGPRPLGRTGAQALDAGGGDPGGVRHDPDGGGDEGAGVVLPPGQGQDLVLRPGAVGDQGGRSALGGPGLVAAAGGGDDEVALGAGGVGLELGEDGVDVTAAGGAR